MKISLLKFSFVVLILSLSVGFISCGNENGEAHNEVIETLEVEEDHVVDHAPKTEVVENTIDKSGPEYTSKYICPMNCVGSGDDEFGDCPICKMAYIENEEYQEK